MLTERITNPWLKFKMGLIVSGSDVKDLIYWVIKYYNAFTFDKQAMLKEINDKFPRIVTEISDAGFLEAFYGLSRIALRRNEVLSPAELLWARDYVKDENVFKKMEEIIFRHLLMGSDHWDALRRETPWTISETEKNKIIRDVLFAGDVKMGAKRKMQLAQEINFPTNEYARAYFKRLLWDRHYGQAQELVKEKGFVETDAALEVIVDNLNNMYTSDAFEIAQRFRPDLVEEIEQIKAKIR
jgi:hypothetical protein